MLSASDFIRLLVFLLDGDNTKMTKMLRCLPITDPVFSDIRFPSSASGIAIRVILETLLPQLPPHEAIRSVLLCPPITISNSFLFSFLTELLELGANVHAIEFISLIVDVFFTRFCILDEFAPLVISLKAFINEELQLLKHAIVVKNVLLSFDSSATSPAIFFPSLRVEQQKRPKYSYETFEWRLMSRMLTSQ